MSQRNLPRCVLIANRGEIALRIARTCRALGVGVVAVYTEHDASAPHLLLADEAHAIPSYLDADAILAVAKASDSDAIHPGYGFLSENAGFAARVRAEGLVFIGPSEEAIEAMGSKTAARARMEEAGVPVVPGCAAGEPAALLEAAKELGFPVLVKAVSGGGGKGMTVVEDPAEFERAATLAAEEATAAFGDGTVYVEKLVDRPRHVEIQLFADSHGNVVSLGERECSIQRRHQKIVEECPSPAVGPELRERLGQAAIAAAKAVDYLGAGTVEFLLQEDGTFYFLEMNTRLQVEHPVTEWVTGLDLVKLQLEVAMGAPLSSDALNPTMRGHSIECRIYAEDPANGHLPQAGPLLFVREPHGPGIRVDSALKTGGEVTVHYDPMMSKLSTWGANREEAAQRMGEALSRYVVLGLKHNIDHLQDVIAHPAFRDGATHIGFLDEHLPYWPGDPECPPDSALAATALPMAATTGTRGGGQSRGIDDPWRHADGFRLGEGMS